MTTTPHKNPPHRPTKLTPEIQEKIVLFIKHGAYVETAAAGAGIAKPTFYYWLKRGNAQNSGIYRDFLNAIEKALAEAQLFDLQNISVAAKAGNWQASAWRLERKFPDKWGRVERHKLEHSGPDGSPLRIQPVAPDAIIEAAMARLQLAASTMAEEDDPAIAELIDDDDYEIPETTP